MTFSGNQKHTAQHRTALLLLMLIVLLTFGCTSPPPAQPPSLPPPPPSAPASPPATTPAKRLVATLETTKGRIRFELLTQDAPKTCENFRLLAERKYFNGLTFHRVIKGFMIQTGDPKGDGTGGESAFGGEFADEIDPKSPLYLAGYKAGIVAMANRGPNTNSSQFFIMHRDYQLPPQYTIFGRVFEGQDVVDAIAETPTYQGPEMLKRDRPLTPIRIISATVSEF
ncbi:peptidylprolyl isomerase [Chloracidobacterium thermophilum]|uniref:Peptidyl-prolyl cis-trans isomerase n=1 Tax=Chloracidobacterium thermophilum (strain B) TaxID=981222 RepID=G2LDJ5_CHLTF|nr:peptidylprolyl isomerase [Chloracidobacterium thermophilum]AEP12455.1 Peptidyl-prolyl cis-trans isomerase (rotamase) - cyclophilin family [Chloracidobacterium thermophilum B]